MNNYRILGYDHEKVFIVDKNEGDISITNSAEEVTKEVYKLFPDKRIIYRDTLGDWDELIHVNGIFIGFGPYGDTEK